MNKLSKNQRGFTLVELIVVMALLAILAVIGITRFAGLTDEARLEADYYLASAIAGSAQAWIAEGDHSFKNKTISIQQLKDDHYLIEDIDYKTQTTNTDFTINYNKLDNKITVNAGSVQFYPIP